MVSQFTKPVGYLILTNEGLRGEHGMFYDYVFAGNGVFIQAVWTGLLIARIPISTVPIRGLRPADRKIELLNGRIPYHLYDLAINDMMANRFVERYVAVVCEDGWYKLRYPWQDGGDCGVTYEVMPNTIMDIHSHGPMKSRFSLIDNIDEQGFRFSMIVGGLDNLLPEIAIRLGIYGYYAEVAMNEVFDV